MPDLRPLFAGLPLPPPTPSGWPLISAAPLPSYAGFRVGRDADNRARLLMDSAPSVGTQAPPFILENVRIEHARPCRVMHGDGRTVESHFTIVCCTSSDAVLREHFLIVAGSIAEAFPAPPTAERLRSALESV